MYPKILPHADPYRYPHAEQFYDDRAMIRGFIESDYSKGMHIQEFWEINIVLYKEGMHYIGDRSLPVKRGDVFIIPPEIPHGYIGGKGFDVFHILFNNRFMQKYMADLQTLPSFFVLFTAEPMMRKSGADPLHLSLTDDQFAHIKTYLDEISRYSLPNPDANTVISNSYTMILIAKLCEIYAKNASEREDRGIPYDNAFMDVIAQIHERYYEKQTITQMAKAARLSRSAFIKKFEEIFRIPPAKFLMNRRIEAAGYMLLNSTLSVSEIAERTGFYDASHLTKAFSSHVGVSPNKYRSGSDGRTV